MTQKRTFASIVSGSAAALLVAGLAVFAPTSASAAYYNLGGDGGNFGTVETASGGVALPGGGNSVAPGGLFRARITSGANENVTITVTLPGTPAPGITVAGTASRTVRTNADGNAFFNIRVPRNTPAGTGSVSGANAAGAVIFHSTFNIAGRAVHPAAG
jgi:hypothetical protein